MRTNRLGIVTGIIFLVFSFMGIMVMSERAGAADKPVTVVFACQEVELGVMSRELFKPWFAEIEKRAGGRVKVEPHWSGELGGANEIYEMLEKGIVDSAMIFPAHSPGKFAMDEIVMLAPYAYDKSAYRMGRIYWELHKAMPEMQAQYKGSRVIWKGVLFQSGLAMAKKKVLKLEDVKGARLPAMGNWHSERLKALGATPQAVPPGEAYIAMQRGIIDGLTLPAFMLDELKFGEVTKYVIMLHTNTPIYAVAINMKKWDSLTPDIQKIFEETGEARIDLWDDIQKRVNAESMKKMHETFGIESLEISHQELARWDEADKGVQEKFIAQLEEKGLPAKKLKEKFVELMNEYSK